MKKTIVVGGLTLALVAGSAFAVMAGESGFVHCGQASDKACTCVAQNTDMQMYRGGMTHAGAAVQKLVTIETNPNASIWDSTERRLGIE